MDPLLLTKTDPCREKVMRVHPPPPMVREIGVDQRARDACAVAVAGTDLLPIARAL